MPSGEISPDDGVTLALVDAVAMVFGTFVLVTFIFFLFLFLFLGRASRAKCAVVVFTTNGESGGF